MDRLDSWKQIAAYLNKSERTVRRWHELEGLPVHKHAHQRYGSVWAYPGEIDAWLAARVVKPEPNTPTEPATEPLPHLTARRFPSRFGWLAAAAALSVLGVSLLFALQYKPAPATADEEPLSIPITALPGAEHSPALSPDGTRVAFRWAVTSEPRRGLYVKRLNDQSMTLLAADTGNPESMNYSPAWSPDGKTIAFLTRSSQREYWLNIVSPDGGPATQLLQVGSHQARFGSRSHHVAWSPDSRWIYVRRSLPGVETGVYRISPETGRSELVVRGPLADGHGLSVSADGRKLAWLIEHTRRLDPDKVVVQRLSADGLPETEPRIVAEEPLKAMGFAWLPDGNSLILCRDNVPRPGLYRLSAQPGSKLERLSTKACSTVTVSRQGTVVVGALGPYRSDMFRLGLRTGARPDRFLPSSRYDGVPVFSPDGSSVAFVSTRSGRDAIWVAHADGSGLREIAEVEFPSAPAWSPDGRFILAPHKDRVQIHPLQAGAPPVTVIPAEGELIQNPQWSVDGRHFYYFSDGKLRRMNRDGTQRITLVEEVTNSRFLAVAPDGKSLYYSQLKNTYLLWRLSLENGTAELVENDLMTASFAIAGAALYAVGPRHAIWTRPLSGGAARTLFQSPEHQWPGVSHDLAGMTVSPDGSTLIWNEMEVPESDLEEIRLPLKAFPFSKFGS